MEDKEMRDYIKHVIKPKRKMFSSRTKVSYIKEKEPMIWKWLNANYDLSDVEEDLYEVFFCVLNNIEYRPICPACGKLVRKFAPTNNGYLAYCSEECQKSEKGVELTLLKMANKILERYNK